MVRFAPRPWDEAYRLQGRLWRGERLDDATLRLLDMRPDLKGGRWLECGCGDGKGLVPLARDVTGPVVGFDASRQGLRLAKRAVLGGAHLVQGDIRRLPVAAEGFDAVRAVHVLGHLLEAERPLAVRGLAAALRPGGGAAFFEFSKNDFRAGTGVEVEAGTFRRGHGIVTHYFDERELVGLIEQAGLEVRAHSEERFQVTYHGIDRVRARVCAIAEKAA